ncbi:MAG: hypothetical protein N4A50_01305 [Vallitalea sp.]|jgi:outer membrane murein-binding lipoprotein Lpp|nr:hypothetical protein [Vallitalea sp.]
MNKKIFLFAILFSLSMLSGCNSTEQSNDVMVLNKNTNKLLEENEALRAKFNNLSLEYKLLENSILEKTQNEDILKNQIIKITNEKDMLKDKIKNLEIQNEQITSKSNEQKELYESQMDYKVYQASYYFLKMNLSYWPEYKDAIKKNLNYVYHPLLLEIGEKISGLELAEIENEELYCRSLLFHGRFKVKLKIYKDASSYDYNNKFEVVDDYDDKVPKDIFTYSKNKNMIYDLGTSGEELIKQIGDSYHEGIIATVILDDYSISYDENNFVNRARYIELISTNET